MEVMKLKNVLDKFVYVRHEGRRIVFPPEAEVEIDDEDLAKAVIKMFGNLIEEVTEDVILEAVDDIVEDIGGD